MDLQQSVHTLGNTALLELPKLAFLCSRRCPPELTPRIRAWAEVQREGSNCIMSGFHSEPERLVLGCLLAGSQPLILVLACGIREPIVRGLQGPLSAGRLLIMSRYAPSVSHPCQDKCQQRNRWMLEMADAAVVAHAAPGGQLDRLLKEYRGSARVTLL
jgi:predicted Rossmann fold nucleotide-binding protein DprA/Smf involved in DNA uptake